MSKLLLVKFGKNILKHGRAVTNGKYFSRPVLTSNFDQGSRSKFILRGRIFFLTGKGTKSLRTVGPKPEARRAENEGGVLGEGAASPLSTN